MVVPCVRARGCRRCRWWRGSCAWCRCVGPCRWPWCSGWCPRAAGAPARHRRQTARLRPLLIHWVVVPTNCVSLPGKHLSAFLPLWTHFSLSSVEILAFLQYKISVPDHPVLLATFPLGRFLCVHLLLRTLYLHTFVLSTVDTLSTFQRY